MSKRDHAEPHQQPGSAGEKILQQKYGTQDRAENFYRRQMLDHLNPQMQEFIARQEMMFVATADAEGNCDSSFRAGLAGFVKVLDASTLIYPEYRGNGVLASLGNMLHNPKIGLMFVDFFKDTVGLHVNGKAAVIENDQLIQRADLSEAIIGELNVPLGRKPERWVLVEVHEAYIHCSKHIPLLAKRDKTIPWGTDDARLKGGDYFGVQKNAESQIKGAGS